MKSAGVDALKQTLSGLEMYASYHVPVCVLATRTYPFYSRMEASHLVYSEVKENQFSTTKEYLKGRLKDANSKSLFNFMQNLTHAYIVDGSKFVITYSAIRDYCHMAFGIQLACASELEDVNLTGPISHDPMYNARQTCVNWGNGAFQMITRAFVHRGAKLALGALKLFFIIMFDAGQCVRRL
jgi:hypothetical protein